MSDSDTDVMPDPIITSQSNNQSLNNSEEKHTSPGTDELEAKSENEISNHSKPADSGETNLEIVEEAGQDKLPKSLPSNNGRKHKESPIYNRNRDGRSKFDPSVLPITDDSSAIRTQVEFYFSDSNLPTDKHMTNLAGVSGTNPVKITEVHRFGRMQRFQPYSAVVAALKESHLLVVTGSEGLETVRRRYAFDPSQKDEARETRTIYAKGFGGELPTTQFDIEAFFAPYGPTNAVRLRRTDDKEFKGSCFIEFQDEEIAQKFLDLAPKPLWQGKVSLEIMSKREYMNKKNEQLRSGEISPNKTKTYNNNRGRGSFRGGYRSGREWQDRDHRDPDDWKKRREDDQKFGFQDYNRDRKHRGHGGMGGRGRGRGDRGPQNNERGHYHGRNGERRKKEEGKPLDNASKTTEQDSSKKRVGGDNVGDEGKTVDDATKIAGQDSNKQFVREDDAGNEGKAVDDATKIAEQDSNKQFVREDDVGNEGKAVVDATKMAAQDSSKKRVREENAEDEVPAKRIDTKEEISTCAS